MKKAFLLLTTILLSFSLNPVQAAIFKDIGNHWAEATIQWAVEEGITNGYPDGTFQPNKTVTQSEFLAMLIKAFPKSRQALAEENQLLQNQTHPWYENIYLVLKTYNLSINQKPNMPMTREKVAEILTAIQGLHYTGDEAIKYLLLNGFSQGKSSSTVEGFEGKSMLTRAEAVAFIKNIVEKGNFSLSGSSM